MGCGRRVLSFLTLSLGAMTVISLAIALSTDFWIYVKEPAVTDPKTKVVVEYRYSRMGLWRICSLEVNNAIFCRRIVTGETNLEAMLNKTVADLVAESVNSTCAVAVVALVLVVLSALIGVVSSIRQDGFLLLSSILFVIAGLALIVGLILFISAVNDEVAHLPAANQKHPTVSYFYAWSFLLAGSSFFLAEGTGVTGIYLFFHRNSSLDDMVRIIPGLENMVPEDLRKDKSIGYTNFNVIS